MTSVLKTYQHDDSTLPLFNGCNNNHNQAIKKLFETPDNVKATQGFKGVSDEEAARKRLNNATNADSTLAQMRAMGGGKIVAARPRSINRK